jgi:hypothetical protein
LADSHATPGGVDRAGAIASMCAEKAMQCGSGGHGRSGGRLDDKHNTGEHPGNEQADTQEGIHIYRGARPVRPRTAQARREALALPLMRADLLMPISSPARLIRTRWFSSLSPYRYSYALRYACPA